MVDSSATDCMSGNKDNFSSLTYFDTLPNIIVVNLILLLRMRMKMPSKK